MTPDIEMDIGEHDGMVVIKFNKPVTEISIHHDTGRQIAEKIAKSSFSAAYNRQAPKSKSFIAEQIRGKLLQRVSLMIQNLHERNKPPMYIASQVVDTILSEAL